MKTKKYKIIVIVALFLSAVLVGYYFSGPTIKSANEAYSKGNYPVALQEYTALANGGNVDAQYALAKMYDDGVGVSADPFKYAKWIWLAAENGKPEAQDSVCRFLRITRPGRHSTDPYWEVVWDRAYAVVDGIFDYPERASPSWCGAENGGVSPGVDQAKQEMFKEFGQGGELDTIHLIDKVYQLGGTNYPEAIQLLSLAARKKSDNQILFQFEIVKQLLKRKNYGEAYTWAKLGAEASKHDFSVVRPISLNLGNQLENVMINIPELTPAEKEDASRKADKIKESFFK